jgi:hypothetical protein
MHGSGRLPSDGTPDFRTMELIDAMFETDTLKRIAVALLITCGLAGILFTLQTLGLLAPAAAIGP